ncbi:hypothetical protein KAS08_03530 [Candidatus Pacearchaeota archaeon]|nr:hypothetical protein [Candidatus Pacearchaeota archaeon]
MEIGNNKKEIITIALAAIILAITVSFKDLSIFYKALLSFLIIITANVIIKKLIGYHFEIKINTKIWTLYQFGFKKKQHFKKPMPMAWLPFVMAFFSRGYIFWLGILEFDANPLPERASRRHGLYRFTEITERHMGWIAFWGVVTNLIMGIIGYIIGFELFAKLNFHFAMWSIIPIARFDGTKIFFANRILWVIITSIASLLFFLSFGI